MLHEKWLYYITPFSSSTCSYPVWTPTTATAVTRWPQKPYWTIKSRTTGCTTFYSAAWSRPSVASWTCGTFWTSHAAGLSNIHCCYVRFSNTHRTTTRTGSTWTRLWVEPLRTEREYMYYTVGPPKVWWLESKVLYWKLKHTGFYCKWYNQQNKILERESLHELQRFRYVPFCALISWHRLEHKNLMIRVGSNPVQS